MIRWILSLGLRWAELSVNRPWCPQASARIDRLLHALEARRN